MDRITKMAFTLLFSALLAAPVAANAAERKGEVVMKEGGTVHLFHSGTSDVKKEICLNDVIPVYRETMAGGHTTSRKVGKVKVLSYEGEHYFEAQVLEGEVKPGDIVKKKSASCLIYTPNQ
ncbi:hypothetical protein LPW11_20020 [Geomonas sp. RF6]|uniref:hypothetical protein n=1 Tax=Geomonas sp. RF6 TaxID=2897342 RepID=UPI001E2BB4BB|nr:hypothetical protein [Geomonas sp. RF6]UFS70148.1 hypothetical protein LPW11_20020 [Geomonas sp. RF6]